MRPPQTDGFVESATLGGASRAREEFVAITRTIAALERRRPGSTRGVDAWTTRRLADGTLIGVPCAGPRRRGMSIADAEQRLRANERIINQTPIR